VSTDPNRPPTEEELRAAYEDEIKRIRVEQVLLENVVTMINLGMRRTGMVAGTESERDREQVRVAIESVRALLPLAEQVAPEQAAPIKQALSQLQLAYVQLEGSAPAGGAGSDAEQTPGPPTPSPDASSEPEPEQPQPGEPGPAQRSGRLWVPGQ
jgi:hypothetical protein